jgi:hypothetical protein
MSLEQLNKCTADNPMPKNADGRWVHENAVSVYESSDGEWERYECSDCGTGFKVEFAQ